ncbi:MAG: multisubunit Na+/H+ antiporter MnhB subunit [Verrucomicrobiales bacterium]|jgi:multisubunit Na+/H+ antiporter MnhB subunit
MSSWYQTEKGYGILVALAFDILLALILLVMAWNLLRCHDLFQAVVLFISFGFLMALVWVRLNAPDIALAEAAIGSAMTGALLLAALGEFKPSESVDVAGNPVIAGLLCIAVVCMLGYAVLNQPAASVGLRDVVANSTAETGVSNPVTAVLLSFRGYDTLLEIAVLLMAVLAVLSIRNTGPAFVHKASGSPVLAAGVRILVPLLVIVSGYLLWVGAHAPGGAFQAGAVLAGAMILAAFTDAQWIHRISATTWRIALVFGLVVFILVGAGTALIYDSMLEYRNDVSKWLILAIESAATISIACSLTVLLVGRFTPDVEMEGEK